MNITDDEKLIFLYLTLFLLVTARFLLPLISSHLFTKDVHIKAYKDDVLLLEYTGKDNSWKKMNNGYSFTVNDKTYIFKDVDVIEITNLDEGDEK